MDRTLIRDLRGAPHKRITVMGFVCKVRSLKQVIFLMLRDRSGTCQIVVQKGIFQEKIGLEDIVQVDGIAVEATLSDRNEIEIQAEALYVLSRGIRGRAIPPKGSDSLSLKFELDNPAASLRLGGNVSMFEFQSEFLGEIAAALRKRDFLEVKTPKITVSCLEGGASLFGIDYFGGKAFLIQSPMIYHQILMAAFERVFEIGPCYRAEKYATIRHLNEFTTVQVAMGFIESHYDLMLVLEELLRDTIFHCCGSHIPPIPKVAYKVCIQMVKKDFGGKLGPLEKKEIFRASSESTGSEFVFVHDFPCQLMAFNTFPSSATETRSFKLLFKGQEVASGGQRIHDYNILRERLNRRDVRKEGFASYLRAFECGIPPHGTFSIGLNRLTAMLLGQNDVRRATLFPRTRSRLVP